MADRQIAKCYMTSDSLPPSIISISDSVLAHLDERVTLQCVADGNPAPNITWFRAGKTLRSSSKSLSEDIRTSNVVLKRAQYNDTGLFSCTVDNGIGDPDTKTVRLSVTREYFFLFFSSHTQYNHTGLFSCTVDNGIGDPDTKTVRLSVTRKRLGALDGATTAIIIGVVVGGLWLLVCVILTVYFVRRRQERVERKKFSFYYDIGRRKPLPPEAGGPKAQDFGPLPDVPLPESPARYPPMIGTAITPPFHLDGALTALSLRPEIGQSAEIAPRSPLERDKSAMRAP
ncbi:hypothetical protein Bbelb_339950 [Branchiostoma belcheri]|nr:hypothetical protein Bbelb_339950 [Branchiostoma belcheri]